MDSPSKWLAAMWSDAMGENRASKHANQAIEAVEIVTFRLARGTSFADFIDANREVDAWLLLQPGFKSRRICEQPGHCIVDMLTWDCEAAALTAMHKLMDELHDSPVHILIDQNTVTWNVVTVKHKHENDN